MLLETIRNTLYIYTFLSPFLPSHASARQRTHSERVGVYGSDGTAHRRGREEANGSTDQRVVPLAVHPVWLKNGNDGRETRTHMATDQGRGSLAVAQACVEHSMVETVPAFDKKIRETGPRTLSKKEVVEVRYLSPTGRTAGARWLRIEDLVGNSGLEQRTGAQSRLGQAGLSPP